MTKYGKTYLASLKFPHLKEKVTIYYWDVWISIILESKETNQKSDLAKAIYEAALQDKKGFYYKHLRQQYEKIK